MKMTANGRFGRPAEAPGPRMDDVSGLDEGHWSVGSSGVPEVRKTCCLFAKQAVARGRTSPTMACGRIADFWNVLERAGNPDDRIFRAGLTWQPLDYRFVYRGDIKPK
jgi:hypothetical protein